MCSATSGAACPICNVLYCVVPCCTVSAQSNDILIDWVAAGCTYLCGQAVDRCRKLIVLQQECNIAQLPHLALDAVPRVGPGSGAVSGRHNNVGHWLRRNRGRLQVMTDEKSSAPHVTLTLTLTATRTSHPTPSCSHFNSMLLPFDLPPSHLSTTAYTPIHNGILCWRLPQASDAVAQPPPCRSNAVVEAVGALLQLWQDRLSSHGWTTCDSCENSALSLSSPTPLSSTTVYQTPCLGISPTWKGMS